MAVSFREAKRLVEQGNYLSYHNSAFTPDQNAELARIIDKKRQDAVAAVRAREAAELKARETGQLQLPEDITMQALKASEITPETEAELGTQRQQQLASELQAATGIINPFSGVQRGGVAETAKGFGVQAANLPAQLKQSLAEYNLERVGVAQGLTAAAPATRSKLVSAAKILAARTPKAA